MYRALGLTRDPFAPVCDDLLFWESPARARFRRRAVEAVARGRGVWLAGPPGSGRSALLERVAEDAAVAGHPAAVVRGEAPPSGAALLALLLDALGLSVAAADPEVRAAALYEALLDAFCRAGTAVLALDVGTLETSARREVELLAGLKVAGRPLVGVALVGGGPVAGFEELPLGAPTPGDLEALLAHRLAACGGADLFTPADLAALAVGEGGFAGALRRARAALGRRAFWGETPDACPAGVAAPVLPEEDLGEVERLLASLSPGE